MLLASALSTPTSAQTRPPDEAIEAGLQKPGSGAPPSLVSLARIRRALELERHTDLPGGAGLGFGEDPWRLYRRPAIQLFHGLDFVGGVDRFGGTYGAGGPVPMGGPTHWAMMDVMTPRGLTEAGSSDVLGIATASAGALVVPYAIKAIEAIAGWLFGDDDDALEHPILTESEETRSLAFARAGGQVLDVDIHQRGRTVALSLVVPADTPPETARALGERFVRLVKTFATAEPDPEHDVGAGDYDYIVRISSPTENVIALGGKATSDIKINW